MHDNTSRIGIAVALDPLEAAVHAGMASILLGQGAEAGSERPAELRGTAGDAEAGDALGKQVGGDHYRSLAIQPVEFIVKNGIPFLEANAIKYLVRHGSKGGAADIRKAIHYCELLLSLQYGEKA